MVAWQAWLLATRPKTLPAAAIPVGLGTALAVQAEVFQGWPALLCLGFALLVQIATNFANDYFDFVQGADTEARIGPTRAVAAGLITPRAMAGATGLTLLAAFAVGLLLLPYGGWWLIPVGVVCLLCAVAYTGGPFPLGYHGLGDVFVFLFFGLVATMLTFYLQAGDWWVPTNGRDYLLPALLVALVPGALATNLIVVNNLRDRETDAEAGKRTLAVRLGRTFTLSEHLVLHGVALGALIGLDLWGLGHAVLLPFLLAPGAWWLHFKIVHARSREAWGVVLAATAAYLMAFGLLLAAGLILA